MRIISKNLDLIIDEKIQGEIPPAEKLEEYEKTSLSILSGWINEHRSFSFTTSGSTGKPKQITLSREKIAYSARNTLDTIDPHHRLKNALLCLDPKFIGGAMVLFRAMITNMDVTIIPPSSNFAALQEASFDLVSMVPLQYQNLGPDELKKFKCILIGGGALPVMKGHKGVKAYVTYGMTETASNIALRTIDSDVFHILGDLSIKEANGCLALKGTITDHQWIYTNDRVEVIDHNRFKWIGRSDFIINSGGIKYNPETIESKLKEQIHCPFIISSMPDSKLGERIILIVQSVQQLNPDFSKLSRYETPKEIYYVDQMVYTGSNKINRKATKALIA